MTLRSILAALVFCVITTAVHAAPPATGAHATDPPAQQQNWYRCNTHTHTSERPHSDANGSGDFVVGWYKAHGYQCLVITDHEYITDVAPYNEKFGKDGNFLVLTGQEITQIVRDPLHPGGLRHTHVNAINIPKAITPIGYREGQPMKDNIPIGIPLAETYKTNLAAVYAAGGIPQVNHPNLAWSIEPKDLLPITQPFLMEVWNAFPSSNNLGGIDDAGHVSLSTEALWDILLSHGKTVWATASDDGHEYEKFDDREQPTPGKGWIVIQAPSLSVQSITDALRKGSFYASNGIRLDQYRVDGKGISITIDPLYEWKSTTVKRVTRYVTRFIGVNGRVLKEVPGLSPRYDFNGKEQYVRASITDSDGRRAWTQPVFFDGRRKAGR